jgi:hypothetical protein
MSSTTMRRFRNGGGIPDFLPRPTTIPRSAPFFGRPFLPVDRRSPRRIKRLRRPPGFSPPHTGVLLTILPDCEFLTAIGAVFSGDDIDAAVVPSVRPLEFPE